MKICSHFFWHLRGNTVEQFRDLTTKNGFCKKVATTFHEDNVTF